MRAMLMRPLFPKYATARVSSWQGESPPQTSDSMLAVTRGVRSRATAAQPLPGATSGQTELSKRKSYRFEWSRKQETAPEWLPRGPRNSPKATRQVGLPGGFPEPKILPCFCGSLLRIDGAHYCGQNRLHSLWTQITAHGFPCKN